MITPKNLSHLPFFPAPWSISDGALYDRDGKKVMAAGWNIPGYCNMPTSKSQATSWATKLKQMGCRVVRSHHIDILWRDHKTVHLPRLQMFWDALKRANIPVIIEFASTHSLYDKNKLSQGELLPSWVEWVNRLCQMDLSNVVLACPVNEPAQTSRAVYDAWESVIRKAGYTGILYHSHSPIPQDPSVTGELSDWHIYCGHDNSIPYQDHFYRGKQFRDEPAHKRPVRTSLPCVVTEAGHFAPAPERGVSEMQIIDSCLSVGAQVVCMYQLVNKPEHWNKNSLPFTMWNASDDPIRMDSFAYLASKMAGIPYTPFTFADIETVEASPGVWKWV